MEERKKKSDKVLRAIEALIGALLLSFAQLSGFTFGNSLFTQLLFGFLFPLGVAYFVGAYFLDRENPFIKRKREWWLYALGVALNSFSFQLLLLFSLVPPNKTYLYFGVLLAITMGVSGNLLLHFSREFLGGRWFRIFLVSAAFPYGPGQVVSFIALSTHVFLRGFIDRDRQQGKN